MSDETGSPDNAGLIETVPLADALGERYLAQCILPGCFTVVVVEVNAPALLSRAWSGPPTAPTH